MNMQGVNSTLQVVRKTLKIKAAVERRVFTLPVTHTPKVSYLFQGLKGVSPGHRADTQRYQQKQDLCRCLLPGQGQCAEGTNKHTHTHTAAVLTTNPSCLQTSRYKSRHVPVEQRAPPRKKEEGVREKGKGKGGEREMERGENKRRDRRDVERRKKQEGREKGKTFIFQKIFILCTTLS